MPDLPSVELPGGRIEYDDVPADTAGGELAPLLFLHEGLGSVGLWRGFHQRIAAATGRRALAYSRFGHGYSDLPREKRTPRFMHDEAATVVPALCSALGLERPVLVGHSDGASIALLAGSDATGVVVLAPHAFVEDVGLVGIEQARRDYTEGDLRTRMARHHRDPDVTFWNWNDVWLDDAFRDWDIRPELSAISCPVLAIQGTADPYGTVAHVEAVRDTATGPVELLVLDCGHAPHLEQPDATHRAVTDFLHRLP
ncbi:alpha/beta fold hydrolase [Pseudonocardia alaniniphila]|uniref:Alpha/beta hydrolase n=1 Tax=Pseudonocardia alaniniphila TaxID=75291 RepID=A0ABS9TIR3_9PSEU|nr:alpha/beta hydrolase [Pseudonocardia alaniniphila]MCH6168407.1 alpha/beta hydrolase [Pseudonocardia alaniniphila]